MIGKLQGIIDYTGEGFVILMAGGVGYKVFAPDYYKAGQAASLWIETIVREDSIRLFGFATPAAQDLFNRLTTVSGVGPKVAMAIMGTLKPDVLLAAISAGDAKTISTAPGVGKKVAEKIIVELRGGAAKLAAAGELSADNDGYSDLLSALEALGYRRADVVELAQRLVKENPGVDAGALVRLALKEIAK